MLSLFREKLKHKITPGQGTLQKRFISMVEGRHYWSSRVPLSWVVLFTTWVIPSLPGGVRQGAGGSVQVLNQAVQPVIKPLLCLHCFLIRRLFNGCILKLGFFVSPIKKSQPWLSNAVHEFVCYGLYCLAWVWFHWGFFTVLRHFSSVPYCAALQTCLRSLSFVIFINS